MTRQEAFEEINRLQNEYVNELISLINNPNYESMKTINFTSPTGTGKTKMMSKLINCLPNYYFVVTTLSRGQLNMQVKDSLDQDCEQGNYTVYGSADYKINSRLDAIDIISRIPDKTRCIWLRDEGHIRTNRYDELLQNVCFKVINFSATNTYSDIQCKFSQTMMLRTVNQTNGTPADAIRKLLEIKASHKMVTHYNPCAIFRCIGGKNKLYDEIIELCKQHHLKYIDITDDPYVMAEICKDDNENDVIINKYKITEGIDIRRAHVLFMDNQPNNNATTIQAIGRCRRNALLYREDIDIMAPENERLLKDTRECYVYYNVENMKIDEDPEGELQYAFCNYVSCEELKANTRIHVENGQLSNGLYIIELSGKTGDYDIITDEATGFNVVNPSTDFYDGKVADQGNYLYLKDGKIKLENVSKFPMKEGTYWLDQVDLIEKVRCEIPMEFVRFFEKKSRKYTEEFLNSKIAKKCLDEMVLTEAIYDIDYINQFVLSFIDENVTRRGFVSQCKSIQSIGEREVKIYDSKKETERKIKLRKLFSSNELRLIQYYCIKRIMERDALYLIEHAVDEFAQLKYSHYRKSINAEKITFLVLEKNIHRIVYDFWYQLRIQCDYPNKPVVQLRDIEEYFNDIDSLLVKEYDESWCYCSFATVKKAFYQQLELTKKNMINGIIDEVAYSYKPLIENLTEDEEYLIRNKYIQLTYCISRERLKNLEHSGYMSYIKTVNDRESAIIGVDRMRQIKELMGNVDWVEATAVTSKVGNYNKFNTFISHRYQGELEQGVQQCFSGKNSFILDKRCNSMIGYCVEYYSKYLVYGKEYLNEFLAGNKRADVYDVVRACVLQYRKMMIECFGKGVTRFIKSISEEQLKDKKYKDFVNLIVELGKRTAKYVNATLYRNQRALNNVDPNLSIRHISGLADYITEDTILDVKVRNNIDEQCIRQVLAYHYLSTKRSDLHINRVIVYDATSDKAITIMISDANLKHENSV